VDIRSLIFFPKKCPLRMSTSGREASIADVDIRFSKILFSVL